VNGLTVIHDANQNGDPATGDEFETLGASELQNISSMPFSPDGSQLTVTESGDENSIQL
jgi:hypothetical protein